MPEGPEIRLAADRIAKVLVGRSIADCEFAFADLKRFERRIRGASVTAIDTRGKAMLTRFDNGLTMYSHNQLYGRWYVMRRDRLPKTGRSLRVALHTDKHSALLYSASDVDVLTERQLGKHPFLARVGPDILDRSLDSGDIVSRLEDKRFRNRSVGGLYLDQSFLAGNGNYLRSEVLFTSGLHPSTRPAQLDRASIERLAVETLKLARRSYRTRGITIAPERAQRMKEQGLTKSQYRHWVFAREGKPCHRCETPIVRVAVSSRGLYYCPSCQPQR